MMGNVLGIDPGLSGALATVNENGVVKVWDMPVFDVVKGKKKKRFLDEAALSNLLKSIRSDTFIAYLEEVGPMPKQGVVSTFSFGSIYGALRQALICHGFIRNLVRPQEWQKALKVYGGKDGARMRASELMPDYSAYWEQRKGDHNRADAALIALHGLRQELQHAPQPVRQRLRLQQPKPGRSPLAVL
jgi:crossover junction endodeoxyribonuclease RuvC